MAEVIFDKKNIIVTGGAGFLGSHLCDALLLKGRVICVDNFISGNVANIEHLLKNPDFIFLKADINTPLEIEKISELERFRVKFQGIQEIYHFACPTSPKDFDKVRLETAKTNSVGVLNMLDIALRYDAKFFHASSSVVYGTRRADNPYFRESEISALDPFHARACYDLGKKNAESIIHTYHEAKGLRVKIARIFRAYGPRMKLSDGRVIPDFIVNALDGGDLRIFGDESYASSFCYVSDCIEACIRLMDMDTETGPVNIGSDVDIPMVDIAKLIIDLTKSKSSIRFENPVKFYEPSGLPDITRAKDEMGWLPVVTLEEGLKRTIAYAQAEKVRLSIKK
ncbi:MAG: GDP-mannose 4,6-dehydratase [Parcubacteria group bacterium]|nr:GDP-mannose 4,6-dehydratase [Parcubacteria group bacterium]